MNNKKHKKGFTLAELLVVIAIIAVLAAIGIPSILAAQRDSRNATRLSQAQAMKNMASAFNAEYGLDIGVYTPTCTGSFSPSTNGTEVLVTPNGDKRTFGICASTSPSTSKSRQFTFTENFRLFLVTGCGSTLFPAGSEKFVYVQIDNNGKKLTLCNEGGGQRELLFGES